MKYILRNTYRNCSYICNSYKELEDTCNKNGLNVSTVIKARRENRESLSGWELLKEEDVVDMHLSSLFGDNKDVRTAVLLSDIHFKYQHDATLDIAYQIIEELKEEIDEVIDLGDGVNNDSLSKYVCYEEKKYNLRDELIAYEEHVAKLRQIVPQAKFVAVEDNHFHLRKKKFLAENPYMKGLIPDISNLLDEVSPHGKLYFPFNQKRVGCIHGISFNDFFTKAHLQRYGSYDVIAGHCHTLQTYVSPSGTDDMQPRRSYGLPSMCKRMEYTMGSPTRQVNGFAILTYNNITDNYNLEYIIVEDNMAIFRGKVYTAW